MKKVLLALVLAWFAPALRAAEGGPGQELFESRCGLCHQLPDPAMLKAEQWRQVLHTMQRRMQQSGMPPLAEEELKHVLDYLAQRARR